MSEEEDNPRLVEAVHEYMAAVEAGERPNRQEFIARHPDIAGDLSACLQGLAFINQAAAQISETTKGALGQACTVQGELPAQPLGDFQLIREIGRGGMGVVYEAVQLSLGRHVALKVLPMASALDQRRLARFKNEAQAAAQLHHTNIVPVYAVGCERSVHFYAMQLIEGQSVSEIVRELRKTAGRSEPVGPDDETIITTQSAGPKTKIDSLLNDSEHFSSLHRKKRSDYFRSVARLGLQAAQALEYAHSVGVVHRDIKPANLLIDNRGNLWITDFGLAQFYGDTGLTQTGDLVGTYRYMSPEQASGRGTVLDQRTDVYSLGVTLYELLTLERALPGETREQLLHQIGHVDPKPPRSIDKSVPVELQTILEKATAKDPAERYQTARALAEDIDRFLHDEPIRARPPGLWDKAAKWTRRHKSLALASIIILLIAASGFLTTTVLIGREQAKTSDAYVLERQKEIEASKSFLEARQAVDFLTQVATDELPNDPASREARKHLLETALSYYQLFLDEHGGDASIDQELTAARTRAQAVLAELVATDKMFRLRNSVRLLSYPSIQRELQLSSQQFDEVMQLRQTLPPPTPPAPPADQQVSQPAESTTTSAQLTQQAQDAQKWLDSILSQQQNNRLRQIALQLGGVSALDDPDVIKSLNLTTAQSDMIAKIRSTFSGGPRGPMGRPMDGPGGPGGPGNEGPGGPGGQGGQGGRARDADLMKRILAQLTPNQVRIWEQLLGPPFDGEVPMFRGPFDGPPPR